MKKKIISLRLFTIVVLLGMIFFTNTVFAEENNYKQITRELVNLVDSNSEIENLLIASIAEAKNINPDPKSNPVQSLSEYYDFIDKASELLPQEILKGPSESVRDQMLQGICYLYFLVD